MPRRPRRSRGPRQNNTHRLALPSVGRLVRHALSSANDAATQVITRVMNYEQTFASSAGGVLAGILNFDPSAYTDWAGLAGAYDQFRMIGYRVRFFPVGSAAFALRPVVAVFDNDDASTALTSISGAADYGKQIVFNSHWHNPQPMVIAGEMYASGNATTGVPWATTAAPTTYPSSVKFYSSGLTVSTNYFTVLVSLVVQFRAPN